MNKHFLVINFGLVGLLFVGCSTTQKRILTCTTYLQSGQYSAVTQMVEPLAQKKNVDQLMWSLYLGESYLLEGRLDASIKEFDNAESGFHDNDVAGAARDAGQKVAWLLYNDRALPYDNVGNERIFCNFYKAIGFATLGQRDEARVEFNRTLQRQWNYLDDHAKEIAQNENELIQAQNKNPGGNYANAILNGASFKDQVNSTFEVDVSAQPAALSKQDYINPYIIHAGGVFRWLNGDNGLDYLNLARELLPENGMVQQDFSEADKDRRPSGQVWIYIEDGLGPRREERRLDVPVGLITKQAMYVGGALPVLVYQPAASQGYRIVGESEVSARCLVDMDRLLKKEFNEWFRYALMREVTRIVVKTAAQVAVRQADNKDVATIAQLGLALYQVVTTAADVRSWAGLPKQVFGARVAWPKNGILKINDTAGRSFIVQLGTGNNAMVWIRIPGATASPAISVITFP